MQNNKGELPYYDNGAFRKEEPEPPSDGPQKGVAPAYSKQVPMPPDVINTKQSAPAAYPLLTKSDKGWSSWFSYGLAFVAFLLIFLFVLSHFCPNKGICCLYANGASCIHPSTSCDGTTDCHDGEDESSAFRLHGTKSMLQSLSSKDQKWLPVCAEAWNDSFARAACEQIGFRSQDYVSYSQIHAGSSAVHGYMKLKPGSDPDSDLKSQLVHSHACLEKAVTLQCVACGRPSVDPRTRIVGGTETVNGVWPWQVSLQLQSQHICGGSIISPTWILTAAHCFQDYKDPSVWRVYSGDVSLSQMDDGKMILKIFSHEDYDERTSDNDIALLKLSSPLVFGSTVMAVCLPNAGLSIGPQSEAWITGWGRLSQFNTAAPDLLNQAQVSIFTRDTCNLRYILNGAVTETMLCAGRLEGGTDTCQGDSGGPLVVRHDNVWWLAGDTSFGFGCALRNKPGVYANVTYFTDWIHKTMKLV